MIRLRLVVAMLLAGSSGQTFAETIRVPQDHKSIQAAINAASAGDTVLVAAVIVGNSFESETDREGARTQRSRKRIRTFWWLATRPRSRKCNSTG